MLTEHKCNQLAVELNNRSILTFPCLIKTLRCSRYPNNKFSNRIHMPNTKIYTNKLRKIVLSLEQVHIISQRILKPCNYQIKMTKKTIVMISTQMNSKMSKMIISSRNMMTVKTMILSSTKQSNKMVFKMSLTTIRSILVLPIKLKKVISELTIQFHKAIWDSSRSTPLIRLYSSNTRFKTSMELTHRFIKRLIPLHLNKWLSLRRIDIVSRRPILKREWVPNYLISCMTWSNKRSRLIQTPRSFRNKSKRFVAETRIWSSFAKN